MKKLLAPNFNFIGETVYITLRSHGHRFSEPINFKISLGIKGDPKRFDKTKNQFKDYTKYYRENKLIKELELLVVQHIDKCRFERQQVVSYDLKCIINEHLHPIRQQSESGLVAYFEGLLSKFMSKELLISDKYISQHRINHYTNFIAKFKNFENTIGQTITFENISLRMYERFGLHLIKEGLGKNTIGLHQSVFKALMNQAIKDELFTGNWLATAKKQKAKVIKIALSEKEIELLQQYSNENHERWAKAVDGFLIGVYTGLRISDWKNIKPENLKISEKGKKYILLVNQKTGKETVHLITPELEAIFEKYPTLVPIIADQNLNEQIKEACKYLGMNESINISKTESKPKHKLITSHTARRTFVTLARKNNKSDQIIKASTGHSDSKMIDNYTKATAEDFIDLL